MAGEKNFENRLRAWLHTQGVYQAGMPEDKQREPPMGWYIKIWGGGFQKSGIPDLLMCVNGIFIAAELKSSVGKPTDLQRKNIEMVNRGGGIYKVPSKWISIRPPKQYSLTDEQRDERRKRILKNIHGIEE